MFQTRHRQTGVLWPAGGHRSDSRKKRGTMREKQQLDMLHGTIWDKIPRFALPVAATAILTMVGVCGIRIAWIQFVFPMSRTFRTIMTVYPVSLCSTMLLVFAAVLVYRPSRRFAEVERGEGDGAVL